MSTSEESLNVILSITYIQVDLEGSGLGLKPPNWKKYAVLPPR